VCLVGAFKSPALSETPAAHAFTISDIVERCVLQRSEQASVIAAPCGACQLWSNCERDVGFVTLHLPLLFLLTPMCADFRFLLQCYSRWIFVCAVVADGHRWPASMLVAVRVVQWAYGCRQLLWSSGLGGLDAVFGGVFHS
jgi:hypothetical protein